MQAFRRLVLGLTLAAAVVTISGCAVAQPVPGPYGAGTPATPPADVPSDWQADLEPYGAWTYVPNYGTVWYPSVAAGWRPYLYGSWAWGAPGWTWYSAEPWGFTYHYGRWAWAPIGWVWVPGFVWGPAWVNWYWGSGFVGWAPIGFYSAVPWAQFVFISDRDFNCHNVHDKWHKKPPKGGKWNRGAPPPSHIQRVAHEPIVRVSSTQLPNRSLPPRRAGNTLARGQAAGATPGVASPTPRGGARTQSPGRTPREREQAAVPQQRQTPQSFAPRRQSGRDNPRPAPSPSTAYRPPAARSTPPTYYSTPRTMRPQGNGYGGYRAYPSAPRSTQPGHGMTAPRSTQPGHGMAAPGGLPGHGTAAPRGMQPGGGMAPPSHFTPRMAPPSRGAPSVQPAPRTAPMAPSTGGSMRSAPMAPSTGGSMRSTPMAPSTGGSMRSAPPARSAPSSGFMGGGRGSGGGRGFSSRGAR